MRGSSWSWWQVTEGRGGAREQEVGWRGEAAEHTVEGRAESVWDEKERQSEKIEKQRVRESKRARESDDNYPLDSCPAPVVNHLPPMGKKQLIIGCTDPHSAPLGLLAGA